MPEKRQRRGRATTAATSEFAVFNGIYRRREIDGAANPRCMQKHKGDKGTVTLYHFTHVGNLEAIRVHGLNMGDVPVEPTMAPSRRCFNNAVWLTTDPDPAVQDWAPGITIAKRGVRLTVTIPDDDTNLWRWSELASYLQIAPEWYAGLNRAKGTADWFVYCNRAIPPKWIAQTDLTRYAVSVTNNAIWKM